jgi:hypothetical protein
MQYRRAAPREALMCDDIRRVKRIKKLFTTANTKDTKKMTHWIQSFVFSAHRYVCSCIA